MKFFPGHLSSEQQKELLAQLVEAIDQAPFFVPRMPRTGKPFSVRMTNLGPLGWVASKDGGYRYQETHPDTGQNWPHMPQKLLAIWDELTGCPAPPEACLVNYYATSAKMGLHQDRDEETFEAPVLSVSLGDRARFRLGGQTRKAKSSSVELSSGDIVMLAGETRLAYHGIDRVIPNSSNLLNAYPKHFPEGGRLNLTLRRVTAF
ncbi:alpha-ketoglutarate-dependent dioxygenase AlkB [Maritalea mediterranea]|uniref:Alpha-ketoglutarate-dependent dioxygenase AlkB n=1 Tax=Maritalea mediterranea TaxID=2909667 RepID=A0ABS9E2E3_9HYPH|nr:alpha-ketoglutarate-dependent dioxygenase AlkB [Maritalea mediterranea]MCF4096977.1 alpha-ketoglutarate-dependent dioxygenase AlkB [Maritalea mediterranea]